MKALLVGGAGFIGRAVARRLLAEGSTVHIADNLTVTPEEPLPRGAEFLWADIRYGSQIQAAIEWAAPDVLFWLAARQGYGPDWRWFVQVNVAPAYALAEVLRDTPAGRGVRRVVLASSQAVYAPGLSAAEDYPRRPTSVYGLSKLQQEDAFAFFARSGGPPVVAFRPSIVLGRGQSTQSSESGVLRNWAREATAGQPPQVYGSGEHIRDFVHVEDVARALVLGAQAAPGSLPVPFAVLNLGGPAESLLGLARRFYEAWGGPEPVVLGREVRPGGEFSLTSSSLLAGDALGWRAELGLEAQVRDFVEGAKTGRKV